ncbi:hypothetical protein GTY47_17700 [Streptomyces sp. SID5464]|nr:DUF6221 family protein [Streptomyces sp. SID5464]MYS91450.1 hypothetical protein [Streptomyces sp. SID5464]
MEATGIAVPPGAALEAAREFVQWLRAQLDEDERVARAATLGPWVQSGIGDYGWTVDFGRPGAGVETADTEQGLADADFIAVHNPARVLREIDAKRRILDLYATAVEDRLALRARMREVIHSDADEFGRLHLQESELIKTAECLAPVTRLLALPYADRPGYREEWEWRP